MPRPYLLSSLITLLLVIGLGVLNGPLLALALPLLVYFFVGYVFAPAPLRLTVTRSLSLDRVGPGAPVTVTLVITNPGPALSNLLLTEILPEGLEVLSGVTRRLVQLGAGATLTWSYTLQGPRGYYAFTRLHADALGPLGLARQAQDAPCPAQLFVLPDVRRLRRIAIRPRRTRVYAGIIPANAGGSGLDFFDVREYQPGDPERWINWRASARAVNTLYANQFQQERVADIGIILDGRLRANLIANSLSLFDHSVLAAATLADTFLAQGDRVSLLLYGEYLKWTLPGYGRVQRERILRSLAQARPGDSQIFSYLKYLPTRMFPPQSQVVLVSPLLNEDPDTLVNFQALGYQLMVISPDPISFEIDRLKHAAGGRLEQEVLLAGRVLEIERKLLLQRVAQYGIQVYNWDVTQPFDQVIGARLRRPAPIIRTAGGMR